jgi:peptide/nickel transport system permease protein
MLSLPTFFVVLTVLAVFRGDWAVAFVIGMTSWMPIARVVRGEVLRWKSTEFVEAAHVIGASDARILVQHILPQALPTVIVSATLGVAYAILTESAISYLGLGIQPPTPSWGNMLLEAQQYVFDNPLLAVYPGVMILLTVVAFNAVGDGLRDALDPRMSDR